MEIPLDQIAALGDVFSGLHFVSGQHPNFDIRTKQVSDGLWDFVLQSVQYSSRTNDVQLTLQGRFKLLDIFLSIFLGYIQEAFLIIFEFLL
jgi:hypothetical protein